MKILNAKYLVLLLMMSFGSTSIHALVDHDTHGCRACILISSTSNGKQFHNDHIDDTDSSSDADSAILVVNNFSIAFKTLALNELAAYIFQLNSPESNNSIRGPPNFLT